MTGLATTHRTVVLTIDAVTHCTEFAAAQAEAAGFSDARRREVELVVEEIVANICRYSYGDGLGNVEVCCTRLDGPQLRLEFTDYGQPFDIRSLPPPEFSANLDQRDVGGVGVPMLHALVDLWNYRREEDRNVLSVLLGAAPKLGQDSAGG
jgi:serine/threonine-protein kinase RsbW